jgi:hypothetical protein
MPTINGAHVIIYSTNAEADRAFFQDVLSLPSVDVGGGWLIFGLPPSEVAVHPAEGESHELYLMCEDIEAFLFDMGERNIGCDPVEDQGWGLVSKVILPGGGKLPIYQPRHARPANPTTTNARGARKPARAKPAKTAAKKKPARAAKKAVKAKASAAKKKPAPKAVAKKKRKR